MGTSFLRSIRRLGTRYLPCLVLVAALAQIALSFHHHEDLGRHEDCAACDVGHQPILGPRPEPVATAILPRLVLERIPDLRRTEFSSPCLVDRARGPPA